MAAGYVSRLFSRRAVSQQEVKHPNVVQQQVVRSASGSREHLKFLVCGRVGVGKSALINSLVGREVCEVKDPGMSGGNLHGGTTELTVTEVKLLNLTLVDSPGLGEGNASNLFLEAKNSIDLILIDSPGLLGGKGKEDNYLDAMYQKCKDADLFLYCLDMTMSRFKIDEIKSLQLFTKKFGPDFWKRCVLVMTKANSVNIPPATRTTNKEKREYHRNLYNAMLKTFREELEKQGVSNTIRDSIPACAVGIIEPELHFEDTGRKIWYVSDKVKPELEEQVEFLTEFWRMCLERVENEQKLKKKDQQVEEITRKLKSELTSIHYQEKRELEQRIKDQELKLTSTQQEKEKMEELLAKHEQERRELESKHKEILKKKDKELESELPQYKGLHIPPEKISESASRNRKKKAPGFICTALAVFVLMAAVFLVYTWPGFSRESPNNPSVLPGHTEVTGGCLKVSNPLEVEKELDSIVSDWLSLGEHFGVSYNKLKAIDENYQNDISRKRKEMIRTWYEGTSQPSWEEVVEALRNVGRKRLATEISEKQCSTRN